MSQSSLIAIISIIILLFLALAYLFIYAKTLKKEVQEYWLSLLEKLHGRLDKIPRFIEIIKYSLNDQNNSLQTLIDLRAQTWPIEKAVPQKVQQELAISNILEQLWDIGGKKQELEYNTHFLELKTEFKDVAQEIEEMSEVYNQKVRRFNKLLRFPFYKPFLLLLGFRKLKVFEFEPGQSL